MLRFVLCVGLGLLAFGTGRAQEAAEESEWQTAQLKKLSGGWWCMREQTRAGETVRRRVELNFTEGKMRAKVFDRGDSGSAFADSLTVTGVSEVDSIGLGSIGNLHMQGNSQQKVEAYYDFVGEKLILVGVVGFRPWEGFHLSGEFERIKPPE